MPAGIAIKPSVIVAVSRLAFAGYFIYAVYALFNPPFIDSKLNPVWVTYVALLYLLAEHFYKFFKQKNIDMGFAFPLLFCIYLLNLASLLLGGQEELPLMNRLEHFTSFVLLAYVVAVFFSEYLPHQVWRNHPYYTALLCMAVVSLFGATNEIIELVFDVLFGTRHVGPHYDTSLDLLMNTLGSGLLLATRLILRPKEQP